MGGCRSVDLFVTEQAWFFSALHCYENKAPAACPEVLLLMYSMVCFYAAIDVMPEEGGGTTV